MTVHLERMSFEDYAAIDAVNWSTLKEMGKSPLHYRWRCDNEREDTPGMRFGRAVHTAVLEPDRFPVEYAVFTGARRAGKTWEEFEAANEGRTILRTDEYDTCLAVRDAVRSHPAARDLLAGDSDVVGTWTDEATGISCKGRIDHLNHDLIVDLKTTATSVDAFQFERLSARMAYHCQLAFYRRGLSLEPNPVIIAAETEPPYDVAVYELDDDAVYAGELKVADYLKRLSVCRAEDSWPGRYAGIQRLTVPVWEMPDDAAGGWGGLE